MVLPEDVQAVLPAVASPPPAAGQRQPRRRRRHRRPDPFAAADLMRLLASLRAGCSGRPGRTVADRPRPAPHLHRADRAGLLYAVVLVVMLIGAINYNLSLGHALIFLLAGLAWWRWCTPSTTCSACA
jgi:hypothetical protein